MEADSRDLPARYPARFRSTVHGTVFENRERALDQVRAGDRLRLRSDPLDGAPPEVWVHLATGDLVGRLPREIAAWLAPWIRDGGVAHATALRVEGREAPSWRRLLLEVRCLS